MSDKQEQPKAQPEQPAKLTGVTIAPKLTDEQMVAWMQGMRMELDELKKERLSAPVITTNVGEGYVVQMNIRGYDALGREVMWNLRGKTLEEFDKVFTARAENINKLQSIRPAQQKATATSGNGDDEQAPVCAIHNKPMSKVPRKDGTGSFYSCHEKLQDNSYCPYKPAVKK